MNFLRHLLHEGISPVVYHYTGYNALSKILSTDKFNLTVDVGSSAEQDLRHKQKYYYFSTTRHKLGGYSLDPYSSGIMLKLDGDKLRQRYSGKAIDYWGEEFRKINPRKAEAEDRIYSKDPYIEKAKQYIMEVHILFDVDKNPHERESSTLRKIIIDLKKSKIPYFIYGDAKNFLLQNKAKAKKDLPETIGKSVVVPSRRQLKYDMRDMEVYFELYSKKTDEQLSDEAKKLLYHLNIYYSDKLTTLNNIIHNNKTKDADFVHKFLRIMRREKITSTKEFLDRLVKKWATVERN